MLQRFLPWIICLHLSQQVGLRKTWSWKQWVLMGLSRTWAGPGVGVRVADGLVLGELDDSEGSGLAEEESDGDLS